MKPAAALWATVLDAVLHSSCAQELASNCEKPAALVAALPQELFSWLFRLAVSLDAAQRRQPRNQQKGSPTSTAPSSIDSESENATCHGIFNHWRWAIMATGWLIVIKERLACDMLAFVKGARPRQWGIVFFLHDGRI